jgi:hypothetical protein
VPSSHHHCAGSSTGSRPTWTNRLTPHGPGRWRARAGGCAAGGRVGGGLVVMQMGAKAACYPLPAAAMGAWERSSVVGTCARHHDTTKQVLMGGLPSTISSSRKGSQLPASKRAQLMAVCPLLLSLTEPAASRSLTLTLLQLMADFPLLLSLTEPAASRPRAALVLQLARQQQQNKDRTLQCGGQCDDRAAATRRAATALPCPAMSCHVLSCLVPPGGPHLHHQVEGVGSRTPTAMWTAHLQAGHPVRGVHG